MGGDGQFWLEHAYRFRSEKNCASGSHLYAARNPGAAVREWLRCRALRGPARRGRGQGLTEGNMENGNNNGSPARLAVAGMGYWGKNLVRNFAELGGLAAVCDSNPGVEATLNKDYPSARYFRDFSSVLADPQIAAVALATPAVTHYD